MKKWASMLAAAALLFGVAGTACAQAKSTAEGIAEYRKMLEDGNPAELYEAKGEALWKQKRGPKNDWLIRRISMSAGRNLPGNGH